MKIKTMIKQLEKILEKKGNLHVLIEDGQGDLVAIENVIFNVSKGEYPKSWGIPDGFKFVKIRGHY